MLNNRSDFAALARNLYDFLTLPRKVHAVLPAMTVYALWRLTDSYAGLLHARAPLATSTHVALAVSTTLFAYGTTQAFSSFAQNGSPRFWLMKYVFAIAIGVLPMLIFWVTVFQVPLASILFLYLRLVLLVSVTESIPGYLISQIQSRAKELEQHQESLVEAEEKFRKTVSDHLHDNLQTRLVAVGIQLNQLRDASNAKQSDQLRAVIDEIELIRSHDVRDFGRGISPQIQADGIESSVKRLFDQYQEVISCSLANFEVLTLNGGNSQTVELGLYRIIEQALSNALIHGRATTFDVLASNEEGTSAIRIQNNGAIFSVHSAKQGHGFAVIDSWVSKLGGSWQIFNLYGVTTIHVEWPTPISHV